MLLNLTNHPSSQWSEKQYNHAIELYQEIIDLPFPQISPTLDSAGLNLLVEEYEHKIRKIDPLVVHIMGEMTFSFRLVQKLKAIGILCIASTTERITEQIGDTKTSRFEFIQFRAY
jgi:hypothetical protein